MDRMRRLHRLLALASLAAVAVPALAGCAADDPAAGPAAAASAVDLRHTPWADQPAGSPSVWKVAAEPSLGFPAGTTYAEALAELLVSAGRDGGVPERAVLMPALPAEVVYVAPADPSTGVRLSLTAPWGWDLASGAIRPPSYSLPAGLTPQEALKAAREARDAGTVLPAGATVDVPDLPGCQVAHGSPEDRPPCA